MPECIDIFYSYEDHIHCVQTQFCALAIDYLQPKMVIMLQAVQNVWSNTFSLLSSSRPPAEAHPTGM